MKLSQVNTLYRKLTPHEQATLTFEAMARRDEADIAVIVDNVEGCNYRSVNTVYNQRVIELVTLALYYGNQYWKSRALMLMVANIDSPEAGLFLDNTKAIESVW